LEIEAPPGFEPPPPAPPEEQVAPPALPVGEEVEAL
jgi:hypothetical protein